MNGQLKTLKNHFQRKFIRRWHVVKHVKMPLSKVRGIEENNSIRIMV
jgi:hypothetical protein